MALVAFCKLWTTETIRWNSGNEIRNFAWKPYLSTNRVPFPPVVLRLFPVPFFLFTMQNQAIAGNSKQLERAAMHAKQSYLQYEAKAKDAMAKGNMDLARVHGESAIRAKNEAMQYLRLQAQVESAQSKVRGAQTQQQVAGQMAEVTSAIETAVPAGAMAETANVLEKYAGRVEELDVIEGTMNNAFAEADASSAPAAEVDDLVRRIAAENAIDTAGMLPDVPVAIPGAAQQERSGETARRQGAAAPGFPAQGR